MKARGLLAGVCIADVAMMILAVVLYLGQDRMAPVIAYAAEAPVYEEGMDQSLLLEGVTAQDDRDGDVTGSLMIEKIASTSGGNILVTYVAADSSANVGKISRTIRVKQKVLLEEHPEDTAVIEPEHTEDEQETETEGETEAAENGGEESLEENRPEESGEASPTGDTRQLEGNRPEGNSPAPAAQPSVQENPDNDNGAEGQPEASEQNPPAQPEGEPQPAPEEDNAPAEGEQNPAEDNANEENGNEGGAGGAEADGPAAGEGNEAPVVGLRSDSLTVQAGAEGVDWNQCIESLKDDKDSRAQLLAGLVMEGFVDLNTPGEYPVMIYTRDSEGLESQRQVVTVRVEG